MASSKASSKAKNARGLSLHIGLNSVDPSHYAGWSGPLAACENDARDMQALAESQGFSAVRLLTRDATRKRVGEELAKASRTLAAGDSFVLTYSGHGGQVNDVSGEEPDLRDETWCLFDGQLIDDEIYQALARFAAGVRILVLSDSCHSGTVVRAMPGDAGAPGRARLMPPDIAARVYRANKPFYDDLQKRVNREAKKLRVVDPDAALARLEDTPRVEAAARAFRAAAILISGCQDNQLSLDGDRNGAFTEQVLAVWRRGLFVGDHVRFHGDIVRRLPASQTPNLFTLGDARSFLRTRPFTRGKAAPLPTPAKARAFVEAISLPKARRAAVRGAEEEATALVFDAAKTQASVVGSSLLSFNTGVSKEHRQAIADSSLLAQLVAKKRVGDETKVEAWYREYFDVLTQIGWVIQDQGFAEYKVKGNKFEAHEAILDIAAVAFGPGSTALRLVATVLDSLKGLKEDSPWITLFNSSSRVGEVARFQVGVVEEGPDGVSVKLMAFHLKAKTKLTQVLFFRFEKKKASLRQHSGSVAINGEVLGAVAGDIKAKVSEAAKEFVRGLEI